MITRVSVESLPNMYEAYAEEFTPGSLPERYLQTKVKLSKRPQARWDRREGQENTKHHRVNKMTAVNVFPLRITDINDISYLTKDHRLADWIGNPFICCL